MSNKRRIYIIKDGEKYTVQEVAKIVGVAVSTIYQRSGLQGI